MAGKYGSSAVTIAYDDAPGGSPQTITQGVLEMGGVKITSSMEASTSFGDQWEESTPSDMRKGEPLTLKGFWDTTATTGSHAMFKSPDNDPNGGTRTLTIVFGDSKTVTMETRLTGYEVQGTVGKLTQFTAEIQPSGTVTWS